MDRFFYLRHQKRSFLLFLSGMILPLFFTIIIVLVFRSQLGNYLLSIFEKKTIDNLNSYHTSIKRSVDSYFVNSVRLLEIMSKDEQFISQVSANDSAGIGNELNFQLKANPQFLTLWVLNSKGVVQNVASSDLVVQKQGGTDLSSREYYKNVVATGKTYISKPIVGSISKITQINISVPIMQKGKIISILCGFISLSQLTQDMNSASIFYDKYNLLADLDGTILTGTIPKKDKLLNLGKREPLYEKLLSSSHRVLMVDDYNYRAEKVFAIGEKISIVGSKDILLFSFLKKAKFDGERAGLEYIIYKITSYLVFLWMGLNAAYFVILSLFTYKHDKK